MLKAILKRGREGSVLRHHPWIFDGAVSHVEGKPGSGDTVEIYSADGRWLARGAFSPVSQIRVRIWTFSQDEEIDDDFFRKRISDAIRMREEIKGTFGSDSFRLVYSESDSLPGLIVDRYGRFLVCQFLSAGVEKWKKNIVNILNELTTAKGIYERSDSDVRAKEGLQHVMGVLAGEEPGERIRIKEGGLQFMVDIKKGHKTGFYLDQRANRQLVATFAGGKDVLNCFSYSGGFGIYSMDAGAEHVICADTSAQALEIARENFTLNKMDLNQVELLEADVFQLLRKYRDSRRSFDMVILDPPKFIASASQVRQGSRGYKDINLLAVKLLRPGGILFTFSCSGYVDPLLFKKIVSDSAFDAGRDLQVLQFMFQGADHPVLSSFPEGLYLKGLICRVN